MGYLTMIEKERILKLRGYRHDCGAVNHYSAVLKAKHFRQLGYNATVVVEQRNGVPYYSIWTRQKKVSKEA